MTAPEPCEDVAVAEVGLTDAEWTRLRHAAGNRGDLGPIAEEVERILGERVREAAVEALREAANERAAKDIAAGSADRFRDVLSECLGHADENPGDDVLVAEIRAHFGKSGPEPTRWRDFLTGALAQVDQIRADRRAER